MVLVSLDPDTCVVDRTLCIDQENVVKVATGLGFDFTDLGVK